MATPPTDMLVFLVRHAEPAGPGGSASWARTTPHSAARVKSRLVCWAPASVYSCPVAAQASRPVARSATRVSTPSTAAISPAACKRARSSSRMRSRREGTPLSPRTSGSERSTSDSGRVSRGRKPGSGIRPSTRGGRSTRWAVGSRAERASATSETGSCPASANSWSRSREPADAGCWSWATGESTECCWPTF